MVRLVFTSDGVEVMVVIRSVERYGLVTIKPTESESKQTYKGLVAKDTLMPRRWRSERRNSAGIKKF